MPIRDNHKISLGQISFSENVNSCSYVVIDENGFFEYFIFEVQGKVIELLEWNIAEKEESRFSKLIFASCHRLDLLIKFCQSLHESDVIDFQIFSMLKRLGVDVEYILDNKVKVEGKRHFRVSHNGPRKLEISPPDREYYTSHSEFRKAMNEHMKMMSLQRKLESRRPNLKVEVIQSPIDTDILTYNERLALYNFMESL